MRHNNSVAVCSIIFGLLKDFHTNLVQPYQSAFDKLEDRHKIQIKELQNLLSVYSRKIASFEIRLQLLERTQRRPGTMKRHFNNSISTNIYLPTKIGNDTNNIYDSPRCQRRVKNEDNANGALNHHNSDITIYESLIFNETSG